jgi:hypothetical protein
MQVIAQPGQFTYIAPAKAHATANGIAWEG